MPSIEIVVSPAGESKVLTKGFEGAACRTGGSICNSDCLTTLSGQELKSAPVAGCQLCWTCTWPRQDCR